MTRAFATILFAFSCAAHAHAVGESAAAAHAATRSRLTNSTLARADKLLNELARLDATMHAAATSDAARDAAHDKLRRAAHDNAAALFARAQSLPAGDLKIDLSTAARLYERAFTPALSSGAGDGASQVSCADERPGAYQVLCERQSPRDAVALLVGKARRHAEWARASVAEERGEAVANDPSLAEMRAERVLDTVVARQALVALSELETLTDAPATLADYEDEKKIGKVSAKEFGARLDASAQTLRRALAWLPESPLKLEIDNAWQSYADALWWWERGEPTLVVRVVNDKYVAQNFAAMSHTDETQVGYNAVVNLRHAREYTRRAAALADAEFVRAGFKTEN
jgi:hypothetical protein